MAYVAYDAILGALNLRQILDSGYESGGDVKAGYNSGGVDPQALYGGAIDPRFPITSLDIAGLCGAGGIDPQAGLSIATGITVPLQKAADEGTFVAGANHFSKTCANGLAVVDSISVDQQGNEMSAQLVVHCRSTNGLDPVTPASGQALAAQAFNATFGLGPVYVTPAGGGATPVDVVGYTVNTGITIQKFRPDGLPAPVRINIRRRKPTIDLRFKDAEQLATFTASYKGLDAVACYGRRWLDADTFELDASLVHAKFSFAAGISSTQSLRASGTDDAETILRLCGKVLTWSGLNAIP